jgi:hypothetical protein
MALPPHCWQYIATPGNKILTKIKAKHAPVDDHDGNQAERIVLNIRRQHAIFNMHKLCMSDS